MEEVQVVIQTKLGRLRGHRKKSIFSGRTYYVFQGIPYGKPPLGELRFKAPQPFGNWEGIRDALEDGPESKQAVVVPMPGMDPSKTTRGDEDCLYLNVYINKLPEDSTPKRPVMFSIHGGGFAGGSGNLSSCGPDYLVEEDIVVVNFNYRCGPFGFLSLENEVVPGNAGLKDQNLALKWVIDNIDSFGGDPNNITIFGISAGGASVDFHMISPASKGLFQKAILQSGFSTNKWALQRNPRMVATDLAETMGCTSKNTDAILTFLQSVSADDITNAVLKLAKEKKYSTSLGFIFTPCVEVSGPDSFLADNPEQILKKGEFHKVPVILGCTAMEGNIVLMVESAAEKMMEDMNKNPEHMVPSFLGLKPGSHEEKEVAKEIHDFYFKGNLMSWGNINNLLIFQSDLLFNIGMGTTRTSLVETSSLPVYSYLFTNHTKCLCTIMAMRKEITSKISITEACHGADISFIYNASLFGPVKLTDVEKEAIKKHIKTWTTFASVGDPNCKELGVTWEKDSASNPCYMDIGKTWSMRQGVAFKERLDFWKNISSKYCPA